MLNCTVCILVLAKYNSAAKKRGAASLTSNEEITQGRADLQSLDGAAESAFPLA